MNLRILSAGAAKGLVTALQQPFTADTGIDVQGTFGAVGAIKEQLLAGAPCDVIVLTAALIEELIKSGRVLAGSSAVIGRVRTGVAVRTGQPLPDISDRESLAKSLLAAKGIYIPDAQRSTAGIHFVKVLEQLGIRGDTESRLRSYPNGAAAMGDLAQTSEAQLIGCTQITEINYTEGVTLVGPLPKEFELATVYSVAVCSNAAQPDVARRFVDLLSGSASEKVRAAGGFEF
ncbi:MAG: periplasmic component of an type molybdate transport system-like protein [Herbaspirillum sp.]|nr:periplasmic component of an type molybdate transport system-like protein [Herbaspirillum sp.]